MVDWPGTQTRVNPYWFDKIMGKDYTDILDRVNDQEARLLVLGDPLSSSDVAVDEDDTIFVLGADARVYMFDQGPDYELKGNFELEGITLNGESVSELWLGWGPGGFLYTWASLRGEIQSPVDDTVYYFGINKYDSAGFSGFWEDSYTGARPEGQPNLGLGTLGLQIAGENQQFIWHSFTKTNDSSPTRVSTWFRLYDIDGAFVREFLAFATTLPSSGSDTIQVGQVMKRDGADWWIKSTQTGSGSPSYAILTELNLFAPSQDTCGPDNLGGDIQTLHMINDDDDYFEADGSPLDKHLNSVTSFMSPGGCVEISNCWDSATPAERVVESDGEFGALHPIQSKLKRTDPRYFVIAHVIPSGTNNCYVCDYEKSAAETILKIITLTELVAGPLTDWYKFLTQDWPSRTSIGTYPDETIHFDVSSSLALAALLYQVRAALILIIPGFLNGATGNAWEVPGGSNGIKTITDATNASPIVITTSGNHGFVESEIVEVLNVEGNLAANGRHIIILIDDDEFSIPVIGDGDYTTGGTVRAVSTDADNIYEQAMLTAFNAGRDYGEEFVDFNHGVDWFALHSIGIPSGNPNVGGLVPHALRAIDFGELHEILLMLESSQPIIT